MGWGIIYCSRSQSIQSPPAGEADTMGRGMGGGPGEGARGGSGVAGRGEGEGGSESPGYGLGRVHSFSPFWRPTEAWTNALPSLTPQEQGGGAPHGSCLWEGKETQRGRPSSRWAGRWHH